MLACLIMLYLYIQSSDLNYLFIFVGYTYVESIGVHLEQSCMVHTSV